MSTWRGREGAYCMGFPPLSRRGCREAVSYINTRLWRHPASLVLTWAPMHGGVACRLRCTSMKGRGRIRCANQHRTRTGSTLTVRARIKYSWHACVRAIVLLLAHCVFATSTCSSATLLEAILVSVAADINTLISAWMCAMRKCINA